VIVVKPSSKPILPYYIFSGLILIGAVYMIIELKYSIYWIAPALLVNFYAIIKHVSLLSKTLTIEGEIVHVDSGLLTKARRSMPLRKLGDVHVTQSLMQRMMGLGDLSISAAGESAQHTIENIDNPQQVCDKILNSIPK
jgi:uncharacterized membrane protein YdbT with pleckstrin-like domain